METSLSKTAELQRIEEGDIARRLRELQWDMASLVADGEMSAAEANAWVNDKAEQWAAETRSR